jgi:two-component system, sensor histidine kinase LadS
MGLPLSAAPEVEPAKQTATTRFEFFRDSVQNPSIAAISSAPAWQRFEKPSMNFQFTKDIIWLRGKTGDPVFAPGRILTLPSKVLDSAILFYPDNKGGYEEHKTGDTVPKRFWAVPESLDPAFRIPGHKPTQDTYFYIRIQSASLISFPIYSLSESEFLREILLEAAINWLILGLCLVMFLIALFQFWVFRLPEFILYAGYVLSQTMWINANHGNAFHFFWPESIWWQSRANLFFVALAIPLSFQFARVFLGTRKHTPVIDKIFLFFSLASAMCAIGVLVTTTNRFFAGVSSVIYLIAVPLFLIAGIRIYLKVGRQVLFFVLSWSIFFIVGYPFAAYLAGILSYSPIIKYGLVFALPVDLFFLLFNLFQKYRDLIEERSENLRGTAHRSSKEAAQYYRSKLEAVNITEKLTELEAFMLNEKPYHDDAFSLQKAAERLGLSRHQLSELVNAYRKQSFTYYTNAYRVEEAKSLLIKDPTRTVLDIAFETGFGSKNAFNREFKRIAGETPQEFRMRAFQEPPKA